MHTNTQLPPTFTLLVVVVIIVVVVVVVVVFLRPKTGSLLGLDEGVIQSRWTRTLLVGRFLPSSSVQT